MTLSDSAFWNAVHAYALATIHQARERDDARPSNPKKWTHEMRVDEWDEMEARREAMRWLVAANEWSLEHQVLAFG